MFRKLKFFFGGIVIKLLILIFSLFKYLPKRNNLWVFIPRDIHYFGDNVKYLYLYISQNFDDINCILLSNNKDLIKYLSRKNLRAENVFSIHGFYYLVRARYIIHDYTNIKYSFLNKTGIDVLLWHGVGIKRIEWDRTHMNDVIIRKIVPEAYKPDILFTTSDFYKKYFSKAFMIEKDKVINVGNYPRNIVLFNKIDGEKYNSCVSINTKTKNSKWILYAPTFRDDGTSISEFVDDIYTSLIQIYGNNFRLFVKYHQNDKKDKNISDKEYDKLIFLDSNCDLYPLLREIDILITDYSSISFDFAMMGKPIILYTPDYQEFLLKRGTPILDLNELGFLIAKDKKELLYSLKKTKNCNKCKYRKLLSVSFSSLHPKETIKKIYYFLKNYSE